MLAPGAPASVKSSILHARLSESSAVTSSSSLYGYGGRTASASEYLQTLASLRAYGPPQLDELIEMMHQFLSDLKLHPTLINKAAQVSNFVSLCVFRFDSIEEVCKNYEFEFECCGM